MNLTREQQRKIDKVKSEKYFRSVAISREAIDEENRRVEVAFSSEEPYGRWFGVEILGHEKDEVVMDFISSGRAPLLDQHNHGKQIGVIEKAWLDADRKGRAIVRFGKSAAAEEFFEDVKDGIRANISVGYRVLEMKLVESTEEEDTFRMTKWKPHEVSFVSVPADESVGVGRSADDFAKITVTQRGEHMDPKDKEKEQEAKMKEIREKAQKEARKAEVARIRDISTMGDIHGMKAEAQRFIEEDKSVDLFREYVLDELGKRGMKPVDVPDPSIGMSKNEVKRFSFMRLVRALADGKNAREAEFEIECCRAFEDKNKKTAKGYLIPHDVLMADNFAKRDLSANVGSAGGYLVAENMQTGSFIDMLRNASVCMAMGARTLPGLVGDADIPKQTGGATAYWVNEGGDLTESQQTLGQIRLTPKTVGCYTDVTRRMMLQSSLDVENFIRNDFALQMALAIDSAGIQGAGASGQPRGILNTSGIGSVTLNAANAPDWGDIVDLETAVATDNALFGSLGYVTNAAIVGNMKQTEKASTTAQFIYDGELLNGYKCMMSGQIPAKYMLFGNWADMIIGMWSGLDVTVDNTSLGTSGGTRIICFQDVDIAIRHAESFAKGYKA